MTNDSAGWVTKLPHAEASVRSRHVMAFGGEKVTPGVNKLRSKVLRNEQKFQSWDLSSSDPADV
jgi:hypothetical protein